LTIELTLRREPNHFGPDQVNLSPPLELNRCTLTRTVDLSPKDTLHNLNTLLLQATYACASLCSALYVNAFGILLRSMRLTADTSAFQMRYPINFVVKHPSLYLCVEKRPALRLLKPARKSISRSTDPACFQIGVTLRWRQS
jgi:hypothetical protein